MFKTLLEHFNSLLVIHTNGCHTLKNKPDAGGYSVFNHSGTKHYAHIFAYENHNNRSSEGLDVHHICENKRCCNPEHLEALAHSEHIKIASAGLAAISRNTTHCPQGHEYTAENTYKYSNVRYCKKCQREKDKKKYELKKLLVAMSKL